MNTLPMNTLQSQDVKTRVVRKPREALKLAARPLPPAVRNKPGKGLPAWLKKLVGKTHEDDAALRAEITGSSRSCSTDTDRTVESRIELRTRSVNDNDNGNDKDNNPRDEVSSLVTACDSELQESSERVSVSSSSEEALAPPQAAARKLTQLMRLCLPKQTRTRVDEDELLPFLEAVVQGKAIDLYPTQLRQLQDMELGIGIDIEPRAYARGLLACRAALLDDAQALKRAPGAWWLPRELRYDFQQSGAENPLQWLSDLNSLRAQFQRLRLCRQTTPNGQDRLAQRCKRLRIPLELVEDFSINVSAAWSHCKAWQIAQARYKKMDDKDLDYGKKTSSHQRSQSSLV
jgi:hypothetical protein